MLSDPVWHKARPDTKYVSGLVWFGLVWSSRAGSNIALTPRNFHFMPVMKAHSTPWLKYPADPCLTDGKKWRHVM